MEGWQCVFSAFDSAGLSGERDMLSTTEHGTAAQVQRKASDENQSFRNSKLRTSLLEI